MDLLYIGWWYRCTGMNKLWTNVNLLFLLVTIYLIIEKYVWIIFFFYIISYKMYIYAFYSSIALKKTPLSQNPGSTLCMYSVQPFLPEHNLYDTI